MSATWTPRELALRAALECIPVDLINAIENGEKVRIFLSTESCKLIGNALTATPAQNLAHVRAAALREVLERIKQAYEQATKENPEVMNSAKAVRIVKDAICEEIEATAIEYEQAAKEAKP